MSRKHIWSSWFTQRHRDKTNRTFTEGHWPIKPKILYKVLHPYSSSRLTMEINKGHKASKHLYLFKTKQWFDRPQRRPKHLHTNSQLQLLSTLMTLTYACVTYMDFSKPWGNVNCLVTMMKRCRQMFSIQMSPVSAAKKKQKKPKQHRWKQERIFSFT